MLSTLNPKNESRGTIDLREDDVRLVARVEQELSKLAHETASQTAPAPSIPSPRVDADAPSERPAPPIDVGPRLTDAGDLPDVKTADSRNDPHDFVPVAPSAEEHSAAAHDVVPRAFTPPTRVAPVFSPGRAERPVPPVEAMFRPAASLRVDDPLPGASPNHTPSLKPNPAPGLPSGSIVHEIPGQARETQPPRRNWLRRAVTSFLLALIGVGATYAWQHHGDEARVIGEQMLAKWAPQVSLPSWLKLPGQNPDQDPTLAAQASQPAAPSAEPTTQPVLAAAPQAAPPTATADVAPPAVQPAAVQAPQPAPAVTAPTTALSSEQAQLLQTMARDLAALQQTIDQLKAGQEQMTREIAKLSEQDARRRVAAPPPPRPVQAPAAARSRPVAAIPPPPPITARRPYPTPPPSATPQAMSPQAITPQNPSPQTTAPRVLPPSPQSYDPDAATAPRPPRPLQSSEP